MNDQIARDFLEIARDIRKDLRRIADAMTAPQTATTEVIDGLRSIETMLADMDEPHIGRTGAPVVPHDDWRFH